MAMIMKEESGLEAFGINKEKISIKKEILHYSTGEDTSTVNLHKDDINMENTGIQGHLDNYTCC